MFLREDDAVCTHGHKIAESITDNSLQVVTSIAKTQKKKKRDLLNVLILSYETDVQSVKK